MAQNDDGAERSQEPTQKRLDEAQKEGRVLTSKESMVFSTMAAATLLAVILPAFGPATAVHWASYLRLGGGDALDAALMPGIVSAGKAVLFLSLVVAAPIIVTAVATQGAMSGLRWSSKGFSFKPDKLDPIKGLGRMVSLTALVELGKAVAKVALLLGATVVVGYGALPDLVGLSFMSPGDSATVMSGLVLELFVWMTLVLALIAVIDLAWQWHKHMQGLRMTFDEVKRESREDNGSPEVKGRQRRMQMEASRKGARERGALTDVAGASVVITNPTHFAVALRYEAGQDKAPLIVAAGRDQMAAQVIERARKAGVRVLQLPPLARALYFTGEIGTPINEGLFGAVASVLAHVWRLDRGLRDSLPEVELPADMRFDARGRPET
jgi:flagellar biosynthesis protein FlhB